MRCFNTTYVILVTSLLVILLPLASALAADRPTTEYAVKAALVYNFTRFTEWPDEAFDDDQGAIVVAIIGGGDVAKGFATINGKFVGAREIRVVYAMHPEEVMGCQLLFVAKTEREKWPQALAALADDPVLIIGEMNGFLETGGVMNLHLVKNKIRFQVNIDHAKNRHLAISSRLLKLASKVIDTKGAED